MFYFYENHFLFSITNRIETCYQVLKAKMDTLPQAILAKAFRRGIGAERPERRASFGIVGADKSRAGGGRKGLKSRGKAAEIGDWGFL